MGWRVPSTTYQLLLTAMRERKQVVCVYQDKRREICPIILGHTEGIEVVLAYQFGGQSSKPLTTPRSRWRCMKLAGVRQIELRDGPWHAGGDHGTAQTCVAEVDYDVNPRSPYNPRFQL